MLCPGILRAVGVCLEENVVGLQVAVDDVLGVDVGTAAGDLGEQWQH